MEYRGVNYLQDRIFRPPLSKSIDKTRSLIGTVLAFITTAFFIWNGIVTSMVMIRTTNRKKYTVARNVIEHFIDEEYQNTVVEKV